jgi:ribonuclease HI
VKRQHSLLGDYDLSVYTDGSVIDNIGTSAAIIFNKDGAILGKVLAPAGNLCHSYRSEMVAIRAALRWLIDTFDDWPKKYSILFCSDSQSSLISISKGPILQDTTIGHEIWDLIHKLIEVKGIRKIQFQFVYSHCGLTKNELVDELAGKGDPRLIQTNASISLQSVKASIKSHCRSEYLKSLDHNRTRYSICGAAKLISRNDLS